MELGHAEDPIQRAQAHVDVAVLTETVHGGEHGEQHEDVAGRASTTSIAAHTEHPSTTGNQTHLSNGLIGSSPLMYSCVPP